MTTIICRHHKDEADRLTALDDRMGAAGVA